MEFHTKVQSSKLPKFEQLLNEWLYLQRDYCKRVSPENPWMYGERPCIGFLAAAATRTGAVTLEEWGTKKGSEEEKNYGRSDLWLRFNSPPNQSDYAIEAKYKSLFFKEEHLPKIEKTIETKLYSAAKDVSRLFKHLGQPLGAAFIAFQQYNNRDISNASQQIFNLIESQIEFDAFAGICLSTESFEESKLEARKDNWKIDTLGMVVIIGRCENK